MPEPRQVDSFNLLYEKGDCIMSAMSDLSLDIVEMLEQGMAPTDVSHALDVPMSWVYEAMEMALETEIMSPFVTVNS